MRLSVEYEGLVRDLAGPLVPAEVGDVLLSAVAERYERVCPDCSLVQFAQSGATYLFDLASAVDAGREDRTVAAWTVTPATVSMRDVSYQRGFPLAADPGNLLPPGPVPEPRLVPGGRRFRALEREAANPGTFYFGHLLYEDHTAYPMEIEIGILRGGALHVERFQNRFPPGQ